MKTRWIYLIFTAAVVIPLSGIVRGQDAPVTELGVAGPGNWSILEIGGGNVSIAGAPPYGEITGNVGVGFGGGNNNVPINGKVYEAPGGTFSDGVTPTGGTEHYSVGTFPGSVLQQSAVAAFGAALYYHGFAATGGGVGVSGIHLSGGSTTLASGVYNLSGGFGLNGDTVTLTPNQVYVFNITGGDLTMQGGAHLEDTTPDDVIFNVLTGGGAVQFNGGIHQESVLDGIILAPGGNIQLTPGEVDGEIIGGANINIASGGSVNCISAPDAVSTLGLTGMAFALVVLARRKLAGFARACGFGSGGASDYFRG